MIRIESLNYMYVISAGFFFQVLLFNSENEHTKYNQVSSIILYSINTYTFIAFCWKLSRLRISTDFIHRSSYTCIYSFLDAFSWSFLSLRQISGYRQHNDTYCDRYLHLFLVTGTCTFRSNMDVGEIMGKGPIPLTIILYSE